MELKAQIIRKVTTPESPIYDAKVILCKDCIHRGRRPEGTSSGFDIEWPRKDDGWIDMTCPFCCDDGYYSRIPPDDFFCRKGEARGDV